MLRVAICDDEKNIASEIKDLLQENCKKRNIKVGIEIYDQGKKLVLLVQTLLDRLWTISVQEEATLFLLAELNLHRTDLQIWALQFFRL